MTAKKINAKLVIVLEENKMMESNKTLTEKFEFGALLYINLFRMQRKVAGKYLNENKCFLFCKGCFTTL